MTKRLSQQLEERLEGILAYDGEAHGAVAVAREAIRFVKILESETAKSQSAALRKKIEEGANYYSKYRQVQRERNSAIHSFMNRARFNLHHGPLDKCEYCDDARLALDDANDERFKAYMDQIRFLKSLAEIDMGKTKE